MKLQDLLEVRERLLAGLEPTEVTIRNGKAELYCQKVPRRWLRELIPASPVQTPEPAPIDWSAYGPWEDMPNRRASPWHRGDVYEDNLCGDLTAFPFASAAFQFTALLASVATDEDTIALTFQALDPICIRGQEFSETIPRHDAGYTRLSAIMQHIGDGPLHELVGIPFRATMEQ